MIKKKFVHYNFSFCEHLASEVFAEEIKYIHDLCKKITVKPKPLNC